MTTRGRARRAVATAAALMVTAAVASACTTAPKATAGPPPPCPSTPEVIQFHGDSLGAHVPRYLDVPGAIVVNRSESRSGFTYDLPEDPAKGLPAVASIPHTVRRWIEECGRPGLVVIQGGINDLAGAVRKATDLQAAVMELSDYLREIDVPTVWLPIHPLSTAGNYMWVQPERQAFNEWLREGHVWGTVVDCNHVIEDPNVPDTLAPQYWWQIDIWGHIDGVHPNMAGYEAWGRCVGQHLPPLGAPAE
jgi:hypothetical protein